MCCAQGSIPGCLLFVAHVNDMCQTIKSNLVLSTDESCLVFKERMLKKLKIN